MNSGSASGFTLTPTRVNPAGHPAKDRGIYFDGSSDGFITIPALRLPHTFAVHAWVMIEQTGIDGVIFGKDRNDFTPASDRFLV